jgi:uncharacterized membrane protein
LLFLATVFIVQVWYFNVNLPEIVASHFDAAGNPNGWMPKGAFLIFEIILMLFVVPNFLLVPRYIEKLPDSLINLPNKHYWLAPERRAGTIKIIGNYFEWFSIALFSVFMLINQIVYRANVYHENFSERYAWLVVGTFIGFTVVWLISLMRKFRKTF